MFETKAPIQVQAKRWRWSLSKRVHDEALHDGMVGIGRVAAAAEVQELHILVSVGHVVRRVVDASERGDVRIIVTACSPPQACLARANSNAGIATHPSASATWNSIQSPTRLMRSH